MQNTKKASQYPEIIHIAPFSVHDSVRWILFVFFACLFVFFVCFVFLLVCLFDVSLLLFENL